MISGYNVDLETQSYFEERSVLRDLGMRIGPDFPSVVPLGEIRNPVAALDSHALERLPNGKLISYLFSNPEVPNITSYDGIPNQWFRLDGTWPCTIDTMVHLRGQRESEVLKNVNNVLDFACGNGPAGIYAAEKNSGIGAVTFLDIEPNAVYTARKNTDISIRNGLWGFQEADGLSIPPQKFDAIIASAIPSTPGYPGLERPLNPLFEGTEVLEKLLSRAPEYMVEGAKLILSHSSVGEEAFRELAEKYGASVDRVLYERDVAFRVEFLNDPKWVEHLEEQGGLFRRKGEGFPYGHKVSVKEVSFS